MTDHIPLDDMTSDDLDQLYNDLAHAQAEAAHYAEAESADVAAGSYAGRVEELQNTIDQVRALADEHPVTVDTALLHQALAETEPGPARTDAAEPRHGLTLQQDDALWDAVAIPGPETPTFMKQHDRVCRTVTRLLRERPRETVAGHCPACGWESLFLGDGGHVTCSRLDCPNPSAAHKMLHGSDNLDAPWQPQADGSWTLDIGEGRGVITMPRQTTMRERTQFAAAWTAMSRRPTPRATPAPLVPCPACARAGQAGLAPTELHPDCRTQETR